jgi:hypothetical protein
MQGYIFVPQHTWNVLDEMASGNEEGTWNGLQAKRV